MVETKCKKCGNPAEWDYCDDCEVCPLAMRPWAGSPFCTVTGKEEPSGGCSITVCKHCHILGERWVKNDD